MLFKTIRSPNSLPNPNFFGKVLVAKVQRKFDLAQPLVRLTEPFRFDGRNFNVTIGEPNRMTWGGKPFSAELLGQWDQEFYVETKPTFYEFRLDPGKEEALSSIRKQIKEGLQKGVTEAEFNKILAEEVVCNVLGP